MKNIRLHARRLGLELLNLIFNHYWLFWFLGVINRHIRVIETVFLMYPATEKYALSYVYPSRLPNVKWNPWPVGLFFQNGRIGLEFVVSATNTDFRDPSNTESLKLLADRMEQIRKLVHAEQKTFAGILTGILNQQKIIDENREIDVTVRAIRQAVFSVMVDKFYKELTPIIILGHKGFIGRRVFEDLMSHGCTVWGIDTKDGNGRQNWPSCLKGQEAILVNIADTGALEVYFDLLWPELIVINEVYPEPQQELIEMCRERHLSVWHIAGIKAVSWPRFPRAYEGSIPCCAAWPSKDIKVKLTKLC